VTINAPSGMASQPNPPCEDSSSNVKEHSPAPLAHRMPFPRDIVVGRNSTVWRKLKVELKSTHRTFLAIGHAQLNEFSFTPLDRVWVLSYSRQAKENAQLLQTLGNANVAEIVYLSSSSTIVSAWTDCYEYPRVKRKAAEVALTLPNARVVTVGLMYSNADELPSGVNIATSYSALAALMATPLLAAESARQQTLFSIVERPFKSNAELVMFKIYTHLMTWCGRYPCLLRPVDLVLRALHMPWYGYTFIANKLWISKIS